jgi:large subunit ribosomal protein L25
MIPAAVNRIGGDTTLAKFDAHTFERLLRRHTSEHFIVTLVLDGKAIPVLLREVQHDVLNGAVIHVDFGEVSLNEKIHVSIPIVLLGEPIGVSKGGGMLEQSIREVEVACLPKDVVEQFEVDTSELKLGGLLYIRDLKISGDYTLYTNKDTAVATVIDPAAAAAKAEASEEVESVEGEEPEEDAAEKPVE